MQEFQTGAVRDTGGKGRMDLIPWCAIRRVSRHMENAIRPDPATGKPHYPERDWERGMPIHCMIDSAFRHLAKYTEGMNDEDHLCAAVTNLLMAMWTEENKPDMQDIPSRLFVGSSLHAVTSDGQGVVPAEKSQEEAHGKQMTIDDLYCDCFDAVHRRCNGTKERDVCECDGIKIKCDFYG